MILAWLVYDREGADRNRDYISLHIQTGKKFGIVFRLQLKEILYEKMEKAGENDGIIREKRPDFALVRCICPVLSRALEKQGIRVFNSAFVSEICNHKGKTVDYVINHTSVPAIPTVTYSSDCLSAQLLKENPGCVIKAVDGHGGKQVFCTEDDWEKIRENMKGSDFVLQPFIKGQGKDVRVYVIGKEIIAAIERTAHLDFRANYSLGGSVAVHSMTEEETGYVNSLCDVFEFGMVGIDFLVDERGKWLFNEIEDVVGARMLYRCIPDIRLLERYFAFILDNLLQC